MSLDARDFLGAGMWFGLRRPPHPRPLPLGEGADELPLGCPKLVSSRARRSRHLPVPRGEGWGEGEESRSVSLPRAFISITS